MTETSQEKDLQILVAFVLRLRRVALHPLALRDDGQFLQHLLAVQIKAQLRPDGTATIRSELPDEVEFESLATRLRPFTIKSDPTYYEKALDALDRLTDQTDPQISANSTRLHKDWADVTNRDPRTRAYNLITTEGTFTDIELAFAWLYQDAVKSDASTTGRIGIRERFQAAVGVFSHIAVVAKRTLAYIQLLNQLGKIELPESAFADAVVVTETEVVVEMQGFYEGAVGADLTALTPDGPLPQGFRPAFDIAHERHQH